MNGTYLGSPVFQRNTKICLLCSWSTTAQGDIAQCVDPCEHYTVLNYNYSSMYGYCDGNFVSGGWYSFFLGGTRARISDSCEDTCPTSYYLKLAETHPTEYNQSASLSLCYTYTDNCCNYHYPFFIKAKLCYGNFYVYKLFDVYSCYNPYCTGNITRGFGLSASGICNCRLRGSQ
uniref:UMOD/GP2/OIT3-like D8C domain-containing protein n=1 Tax=Oryzias melastigma TaxID=30732 RepID=A0A3B3BDL8_ORYME